MARKTKVLVDLQTQVPPRYGKDYLGTINFNVNSRFAASRTVPRANSITADLFAFKFNLCVREMLKSLPIDHNLLHPKPQILHFQ